MSPDPEPLKLPLDAAHRELGATMGIEGGWDVPLSYGAPLAEAAETRRLASVFDISHVGRIRIRGGDALSLVEKLCTTDVVHQEDDTAAYTLLLNESGGILADAIVARLEGFWLVTTDPCNRDKVLDHAMIAGEGMSVKVDDQTEKGAMVAISGPGARGVLDSVLPEKPGDLAPGAAKIGSMMIARYIVMRTSFTGMWGLEVILPKMFVGKAWQFITEKAGDKALKPAGIVARDILRIEAGLCRYGYELNETIDPVTAGLESQIDFEHDFFGRQALTDIRNKGVSRKRVGLRLDCSEVPVIARLGDTVYNSDGLEVGAITSGTFSPALDCSIAMAYVSTAAAETGTVLEVEATSASRKLSATVTDLPFVP
ncbi:MAG: glycine cleavage T C-terminal barrel domain-containing protein [Phycisphaerae bacterium]|jgi:aminomethyltransferase|nr:glycine cleavage T C-terminal barrel domain-containing protein [Phycisphaerae bacterium]